MQGKWGAIGMSRKATLMHKPLEFAVSGRSARGVSSSAPDKPPRVHPQGLSSLVKEFCRKYRMIGHTVTKVYCGLPFSHDVTSTEQPLWRAVRLRVDCNSWTCVAGVLDDYGHRAPELYKQFTVRTHECQAIVLRGCLVGGLGLV